MCLILLAVDARPDYGVVLASNRDEWQERPASPAAWWADAPQVLAGRDLKAGGTWMGVSRAGGGLRWAAVTNVRDFARVRDNARSRGELVRSFLMGDESAAGATETAQAEASEYSPFNFLASDADGVWYASSHTDAARRLDAGVYGMSNATLDTPWPKVVAARAEFSDALAAEHVDEDGLFRILADRGTAPDADLPDTGIGRAWERALSARFIVAEGYGSRASTVLLLDRAGGGRFVERSFGEGGVPVGEEAFDL